MHHFLVGVFSRQISLCRNFHSKVGVGVISVEYGIIIDFIVLVDCHIKMVLLPVLWAGYSYIVMLFPRRRRTSAVCVRKRGGGQEHVQTTALKGTPIHRIVKGFIVQGGDFRSGEYN